MKKNFVLDSTITKDILRKKLRSGQQPAMKLLYSRYGGMLFSYVLQFVPDKAEAGRILVNIFSELAPRLQQACDSNLSIYCWLQVEARKILLEFAREQINEPVYPPQPLHLAPGKQKLDYFSLLREASPEQQWAFRELFLNGREKEDLAREAGMDPAYIAGLLRESLVIIRKKLG